VANKAAAQMELKQPSDTLASIERGLALDANGVSL
jgi:hypothetical protein